MGTEWTKTLRTTASHKRARHANVLKNKRTEIRYYEQHEKTGRGSPRPLRPRGRACCARRGGFSSTDLRGRARHVPTPRCLCCPASANPHGDVARQTRLVLLTVDSYGGKISQQAAPVGRGLPVSQAHPRAGFSQAASMETKASSSAAFANPSPTPENQRVPEPRQPGQASRGRRAVLQDRGAAFPAALPAADEHGCALRPPAHTPLSPERQRQGRGSHVTHNLVLAAGESDGGRFFPNLVWTQVAIDIRQDSYAIYPLGTVPHPAQIHRLGATQQTHGCFRGTRLCNTTRNKSPSVTFPSRTELWQVKPDMLHV